MDTVVILSIVFAVVLAFMLRRPYIKNRRKRFLEHYVFPESVLIKFSAHHPDLSDKDVKLVFEGLRSYLQIHQSVKGVNIAMPSKIVDDAWHEFILFTKIYHDFCEAAFGRYLHHTPSEAMQAKHNAQTSLKHAWHQACQQETINPRSPSQIPLLFALDGMLHITGGYNYTLDKSDAENHIFNAKNIRCTSSLNTTGGAAYAASGGNSSDAGDSGSDGGGDGGCSGGCGGGCGGS